MINSSKFIPSVMSRNRDVQTFTKLIDILVNTIKSYIDNLCSVYDANTCNEEFLPFLAKTLNYEYNNNDTVTSNRKIIDIFAILEKNRGSEVGIKMATASSLTALDISANNTELDFNNLYTYYKALTDIDIVVDYENGIISVEYPNTYTLVRYLIDYVRPVGMYTILRSVVPKDIKADVMLIYANAVNSVRHYTPSVDSAVGKTVINFSSPVDDTWIDQFSGEINLGV